jgi:hypothetical protein
VAVAAAACAAVGSPGATATAGAAARGPGHAAYEIAASWDSQAAALRGTERIAFTNTRQSSIRSVWLRLWASGGASCAHPRIVVRLLAGGTASTSAASCTAQKVHLAHELGPGKRTAIRLHFAATVPSGTASFGRPDDAEALLGNALPILAVTDAAGTHLEPYSATGEAGYSLASKWQVKLDLPSGLRAATTGTRVDSAARPGGRRTLTFVAPRARDFELAIGDFHVQTRTADGVRVRLFDTLPAGAAADAARSHALAVAATALLGFQQRFGSYGAPELDVVQTPSLDGEGMEYPELVMVQMPPGSDVTDGLLAHEIAHQWFYGIVGDNQWREPWLDESFATFAAGWPAHGCTSGDPLAGYPSDVRLTSTMGFFDSHPDGYYYSGLYGGGACALRDLRAGLGGQRFDTLLRSWVAARRYAVGTTAGFVAAVRAAAPPGFDVDAFLRASRIDVP